MSGLGLIIGMVYALAFRMDNGGLSVALISITAMILLHTQLPGIRARGLLWLLFGFAYYATSLFWIQGYLFEEYGDAPWLRFGLWPILIFFLSSSFLLIPGVLMKLSTVHSLIALPFVLVSLDILREYTRFSFPWLHPGLLMLDVGLSGWLSAVGALGGSFLAYTCASLIAWPLTNWDNRVNASVVLMAFLVSVALIESMIQSYGPQVQTGRKITIRVLHSNISAADKRSKNKTIERMQRYIALSLQAPKVDWVVWPESAMPFPYTEIAPYIRASLQRLRDSKVIIIWGGQTQLGSDLLNVIYRSDLSAPIYYKQRLVPFGEYRPTWFVRWIPGMTLSHGADVQTQPNLIKEHHLGPLRAVLAVCYEALYSDVFIAQVRNANVALLLSDLEWTHSAWLKQRFLTLARVRAAEIGKALIYPTNQGITALIAPNGDIISQNAMTQTQIMDAAIPLKSSQTLYTRFGHRWLLWVAAVVLLLVHHSNKPGCRKYHTPRQSAQLNHHKERP